MYCKFILKKGSLIFVNFCTKNHATNFVSLFGNHNEKYLTCRTRAIITRGLYTFYPLFEVQKHFFRGLLSILALCMVSNQEPVIVALVLQLRMCVCFLPDDDNGKFRLYFNCQLPLEKTCRQLTTYMFFQVDN